MRFLGAAVLVLCGCNEIYNLEPARARDAAPDAAYIDVRYSLLVGDTTDSAMEARPVLAAAPDPKPRVGPLDGDLQPASYTLDGTSGRIAYPPELVPAPWRLEYTPPSGIPHEVQWKLPAGAGHLIVPYIGHPQGTPVPAGTGFQLSLANHTFSERTVIYTTGYWSHQRSTQPTTAPAIDFATATPFDARLGAPIPTDIVVAIDYTVFDDVACRRPFRVGSKEIRSVVPGSLTAIGLDESLGAEGIGFTYANETLLDATQRLSNALGARSGSIGGSAIYFGRIAHTRMPGFTTTYEQVPAPPFILLAECTILVSEVMQLKTAGTNIGFEKAAYGYVTNDRVVAGVQLRSSIASIGLHAGGSSYQMNVQVPVATGIKLGDASLEQADMLMIPATRQALTFELLTTAQVIADYYEVTLYRIADGALTPVRVYVGIDTTNPSITFDPTVMTAGDQYVFAIRTYRGRPDARNGNFETVMNPQAVSTMFTYTFRR